MDKIGRYEIEKELTQGGMGVIFLARDPFIQRKVVVKVLMYKHTLDEIYREFFQQEAELIAALEHPCIVPIYDFGWHSQQPYIVMRYMAGGSLEDRMRKEEIKPTEIAHIITRISGALDAAHASKIVHRDVKPSNFLYDSSGEIFLSDFGIAKSKPFTDNEGDWLVGTPAYMCPELVQGHSTDGRADIYSLGIVLYRMLTGLLPFKSDSTTSLINAHVELPVPDLRLIKSNLPEAWHEVTAKALAKEPADRYATAGEMAKEIEQIAAGKWFLRKI